MARMNGPVGVIVSSLAVLVVVLVGWFVFISPQRSKADRLDAQKAAVDTELASDQALLAAPRRRRTEATLRAAQRALPNEPRVSDILRQLAGFAQESRTELDAITPGTATPIGAAEAIPIALTFKGRYFGLQKLLRLFRESADVKKGVLVSTGRLYTVDSIQFTGGAPGGDISATIALNAYVYTGSAAPAAAPTTTTATTAAAPTG